MELQYIATQDKMVAIGADRFANPGSGLPAIDIHFKEIGHILQSVSAGTNILALVSLHFN